MSKCKNARCEYERGHKGPCSYLRNHDVTTEPVMKVVTCNQSKVYCAGCVEKDAEIARLRSQVEQMAGAQMRKPKRDRAQYMRDYRKKPLGVPYG